VTVQIAVDYERCEGHGLCEEQAPEVFALDDAGDLDYRFDGQDVPAELAAAAARATGVCPVAALKVVQ
jgi:ferredoxin